MSGYYHQDERDAAANAFATALLVSIVALLAVVAAGIAWAYGVVVPQ